jgi:putative endonuclease
MAEHNDLGIRGEAIATDYLQKKGYIILHKNWRFKKDELDIVANFQGFIVFVEVKTRVNNYVSNPEEAVTKGKQQRLIRAANAYIENYQIDFEARFDVIGIIKNQHTEEIVHIEQAFQPHW